MAETWRRVKMNPQYGQMMRKYGSLEEMGKHPEWHTLFQGIWKQIERERGL